MPDTEYSTEEVERIAKARMAYCALRHYVDQESDFRVLLLLHRAGVLKKDLPRLLLESETVAVVRDPTHKLRIPGPQGPVVFVESSSKSQTGEAIFTLELLCAPQADARSAVLAHFEHSAFKDGSYFSPVSEKLLQEYGDDIRSEDSSRWVGAAMRLERELDADFKFNLAAFGQGIFSNLEELSQQHWQKLLHPSVASLLSMRDDGYELIANSDNFETAVSQMIEESYTLCQLLDRYDQRLGHLPLHHDLSIGAVVRRWMNVHPNDQLLSALRAWEKSSSNAVHQVHVCQIMLLNQDGLSKDQQGQLWGNLNDILKHEQQDGRASTSTEALLLEADLARHYFRYLESRTAGTDVDRLSTVAWWAANAVTDVIIDGAGGGETSAAFLETIRCKSLNPALEACHEAWGMSHPVSGVSRTRFATMLVRNPRVLGLLIATGHCVQQSDSKKITADQRIAITKGFSDYLLGYFPFAQLPPERPVWAFDSDLFSSYKQWATTMLDASALAGLQDLIAFGEELSDSEKRREALRILPTTKEPERSFLARLFFVLALTSTDDTKHLWKLSGDKEWREACFKNLSQPSLEMLFGGIMEVHRRCEEAKGVDVSRWFADAVEFFKDTPERQSLFFGLTIVSSAVIGTVSAVRRIVSSQTGSDLAEDVDNWRTKAKAMQRWAPPLLSARLRDILSSLRTT